MTDYMVEGLVKKRAELAGEVERTHQRLRELVNQLGHLDETLKIVAPDIAVEAIAPKVFRPPADWSRRGEMRRVLLSILRTARDPMTSREIAMQMIVERGAPVEDKILNLMSKRCATALRDLRDKGLAKSTEGPAGFWLLWQINRA